VGVRLWSVMVDPPPRLAREWSVAEGQQACKVDGMAALFLLLGGAWPGGTPEVGRGLMAGPRGADVCEGSAYRMATRTQVQARDAVAILWKPRDAGGFLSKPHQMGVRPGWARWGPATSPRRHRVVDTGAFAVMRPRSAESGEGNHIAFAEGLPRALARGRSRQHRSSLRRAAHSRFPTSRTLVERGRALRGNENTSFRRLCWPHRPDPANDRDSAPETSGSGDGAGKMGTSPRPKGAAALVGGRAVGWLFFLFCFSIQSPHDNSSRACFVRRPAGSACQPIIARHLGVSRVSGVVFVLRLVNVFNA